jgi:hypothetical protein
MTQYESAHRSSVAISDGEFEKIFVFFHCFCFDEYDAGAEFAQRSEEKMILHLIYSWLGLAT